MNRLSLIYYPVQPIGAPIGEHGETAVYLVPLDLDDGNRLAEQNRWQAPTGQRASAWYRVLLGEKHQEGGVVTWKPTSAFAWGSSSDGLAFSVHYKEAIEALRLHVQGSDALLLKRLDNSFVWYVVCMDKLAR